MGGALRSPHFPFPSVPAALMSSLSYTLFSPFRRLWSLSTADAREYALQKFLGRLLLMTFIGRKLRHAANAPSQPLHDYSYPRTGTFSVVS